MGAYAYSTQTTLWNMYSWSEVTAALQACSCQHARKRARVDPVVKHLNLADQAIPIRNETRERQQRMPAVGSRLLFFHEPRISRSAEPRQGIDSEELTRGAYFAAVLETVSLGCVSCRITSPLFQRLGSNRCLAGLVCSARPIPPPASVTIETYRHRAGFVQSPSGHIPK